jgi:hypothetical protein
VTIQPHPRAVQLKNPKWYVITDKNYNDFKKKFLANNKDFVVYGVSPEDFKKLLNNQAELLRYIRQQNATILYYEKTVN